MSKVFDQGNAILNDMVKEQLFLKKSSHILEIGFGTGKLIGEIAAGMDQVVVEGIDFSNAMVSMARKRNKKYIDDGTVILKKGDFDRTVYDKNSYDTVCSTNTIYFWPTPQATLVKIFDLLRPGGRLILGFEDIGQMEKKPISRDVFKFYHTDDMTDLLKDAGFPLVEINSKKVDQMLYHCVVAHKAAETGKNDL